MKKHHENTVIERSFRTDNELNTWFQNYLIWYNNERSHFGIGIKTPLEVIESVLKVLKH